MYQLINKPEYTKGIWVVLIISLSKLVELALGTGNAILVNSIYYKIFFYLSIAMAVSVILLNKWLIAIIGIDGAALATLLVMIMYSGIKILYIKSKFKIQPFSTQTIKVIAIIAAVFLIFYFLNFSINPVISILLKSVIIALVYIFLINKTKVSEELNSLVLKFIKK
jgi:O-antigen/teichoic acid export membrane protein